MGIRTRDLYLVRHAHAVARGTPGIDDDLRPLIGKGERAARLAGRALRRIGVEPELIATSPLPRAERTARILAHSLGCDALVREFGSLRAECEIGGIAGWLQSRRERVLIVVGHDPWISELIGLLAGGEGLDTRMPKAGIACLKSRAGSGYELEWLLRPKLVRALLGGSGD